MHKKHRLILVDGQPLFREGVKSVMARNRVFDIVGEAGTASDGLHLVQRVHPDMALVDMFLPDLDGAAAVSKILEVDASIRVLMAGTRAAPSIIVGAIKAGAAGFVAKSASANQLAAALDAVMLGDTYLDGTVSGAVVDHLISTPRTAAWRVATDSSALTARETEILRLLAEGRSTREIAATLYISPKTVDNHRANIMRKLRLENLVGLVRYAIRMGLIDVEAWCG